MTVEFINRVTKVLNNSNVEYVLTGGCAQLLRNQKSTTLDLDILVKVNQKNIEALIIAINKLGVQSTNGIVDLRKDKIIRIQLFPFSIDIMPRLDGLKINDVFRNKQTLYFEDNFIPLISERDLTINYKNI